MADLAWFVILVVAVLVIGVGVGMLVAPILTRWTDRQGVDDEEPDAGNG